MAEVFDGGTSPASASWQYGSEYGNESAAGETPVRESGCKPTKCLCQNYYQQEFMQRLRDYADVKFQWRTFWKELVYHLIFPFSLPLIYAWEGGSYGIINRQFWGSLPLPVSQWFFSLAFFCLNGLAPLYFSPDIVFVDALWIVRCLILAVKYGFTSDGEMHIMRTEVLPREAHAERTLVLAWTHPIPLRVLKRQLILAALRKNLFRLNGALRLVPGASDKTIHEIMLQLTDHPKEEAEISLKGRHSWDSLDRAIGFDERSQLCARCLKVGGRNKCFETRWLELCMSDVHKDPELIIPSEEFFQGTEETRPQQNGHSPQHKGLCPALDLPALLLAAYILQRAGDLLPRKKFLHQLFSSPWKLFGTSQLIGFIHAIIPFATRALVGTPSTFGGSRWFHYVVSASSFLVSFTSMGASVLFMLGGLADFRRRYFVARLLNTLLKDGCVGDEIEMRNGYRRLWDVKKSTKSPYHLGLAINFTDPRSILGWWSVRCLVQDFGLVFYMRVKYYASFFAMYCGFLMAYLVVKLFASNAKRSSYLLALVVFDLLVFTCLLGLVVSPGGDTNKMNVEHGATISRIKMAISTNLERHEKNLDCEDRTRLEIAVELMDSISGAIYWDNSVNQITFLGFKAGAEVLGVLIGAGSTAVGIAAQQLTATIS
ncbi:hypothetical protein R1sor_002771 [Riccia sorocarpa]|uniref:Odorant receptor n=1 Tax=Riccia sorocarpa TaxID=122646 RepID=A0ABD3H2H0_9MARC